MRQKYNFSFTGGYFDLNYLSNFSINFHNSCGYHVPNFQGCWKKVRSSSVRAPEPDKMTKTKSSLTFGTPCKLYKDVAFSQLMGLKIKNNILTFNIIECSSSRLRGSWCIFLTTSCSCHGDVARSLGEEMTNMLWTLPADGKSTYLMIFIAVVAAVAITNSPLVE